MVENTCPILRVQDLQVSVDYYVEKLGFSIRWQDQVSAGLYRDNGGLMLIERSQGHPGTWVWIGVHDVEKLYQEFLERGVVIRHPPENYPWALEMKVNDLDGHVLRFGSGPKEDEPFVDFTG